MNAKMTITLPVEDIPQEVSRILENINEKLKRITEQTSNISYSQDHNLVASEIDDIRKQLSLVDLNYEDCYSVLLGYIKYENDKRLKEISKKEVIDNGSNNK